MRAAAVLAGAASQSSIDIVTVLLILVLISLVGLAVGVWKTRVSWHVATSLRTSSKDLEKLFSKGHSDVIDRLADITHTLVRLDEIGTRAAVALTVLGVAIGFFAGVTTDWVHSPGSGVNPFVRANWSGAPLIRSSEVGGTAALLALGFALLAILRIKRAFREVKAKVEQHPGA